MGKREREGERAGVWEGSSLNLEKKNEVEKINLKESDDIYRGKGIKCFGWEN